MVLIPHGEIPVDPDAPEARRWLEDELSKPEYQSAQPNAFDLAMQAIRDWIAILFEGATGIPGPLLALLAVTIVAVLVVVGLLVFGVPRLRRRRRAAAPLFDDADRRDLETLRRAAAAAAAAGDWPLAIEERFRALARGLVERDLIRVHPGTTARGVADAATSPFPGHGPALRAAAADFDAVRYLGRPGTRERYRALTDLERAIAVAAPAGTTAVATAADAATSGAPR
ncbi:DUF4129 domain-containing protein [Agromyces bauzanensis]|uniref:Protein-glutamine gamma-glutamyltransferase-like C-terminal domain-containing protein n=1 Tax=Agromyces bauzanensis TaxID=1308924 RepID=A0A917PCP9_9MICO|nr:DUF4129 domain-containing protein [Agromyces bauzanensis]GGJ71025.1 hypothetical protein GCM10011372_06180 [Agromyces bauzanensis]